MAFFLRQAEGFLDAVDKKAKEASSKEARGQYNRRYSEGSGSRTAGGTSPVAEPIQQSSPTSTTTRASTRRQTGPALSAAPSPARPSVPVAPASKEQPSPGRAASNLQEQGAPSSVPLGPTPSQTATVQQIGHKQQPIPADIQAVLPVGHTLPEASSSQATESSTANSAPDSASPPDIQHSAPPTSPFTGLHTALPNTSVVHTPDQATAPAHESAYTESATERDPPGVHTAAPSAAVAKLVHGGSLAVASSPISTAPQSPAADRTKAIADAIKLARAASKHNHDGAASDAGSEGEGPDGLSEAQTGKRQLRLVGVVDQLKRRLDLLRDENLQLESMLHAADARTADSRAAVSGLEDALARAEAQGSAAQAAHATALAAREADLQQQRAAQAHAQELLADVQGSYASLQDRHRQLVQEHEANEGEMTERMRQQVDSLESRLDNERVMQATTQRTFAAREAELESNLAESAGAMAAMQRALEERAQQASVAADHAHSQAAEAASLRAQLAQLGQQQRQQQAQALPQPPAELLEELGSLHRANADLQATCQAAQSQNAGLQAECQRLQGQIDSLRGQLHHHREMPDLQRQFKEVTDLLYQKQTQLEEMAAGRAVQQMTHERELTAAKSEAERTARGSRRQNSIHASSLLSDGDLLVPMDAMGESYHRLTRHRRFGHAIKTSARALDSWSAVAVQFLKRYPLGRLGVLAYLVCLHLFVWLLIHRMQRVAFSSDPRAAQKELLV